jgi:hypothetical protein
MWDRGYFSDLWMYQTRCWGDLMYRPTELLEGSIRWTR